MKEILFKAKTKVIAGSPYNGGKNDGEWVKGFVYNDVGCWKIKQFDFDCADYMEYEVDPDTICQYVNIKDKNGEKIFEKDRVRVEKENMEYIGYIGYNIKKQLCIIEESNDSPAYFSPICNFKENELVRIGNILDPSETNEKINKALHDFKESIKSCFYSEFNEPIPSIMSDKIDEIVEKFSEKIKEGETKEAYWFYDSGLDTTYCSNCKNEPPIEFDDNMDANHKLTRFCDNCGSKMLNANEDNLRSKKK